MEWLLNGFTVFFQSEVNVLELIVVIAAQHYEYTNTTVQSATELYTLKY